MAQKTNARKAKLDKIATKIAMFIVEDTYTDETEQQKQLSKAIQILDNVGKSLEQNDAAQAIETA